MRSVPTRKAPAARGAPEGGIEALLHAACVRAGAGAALQVWLERLPLLQPFVPATLKREGTRASADDVQRGLVREIYRRYRLEPAGWELEGVLAVARTQAAMTPLATREGLGAVVKAWLPAALSGPLLRYTPLEPLVIATVRAVGVTWAAGRYADSVCRLRKAGADWLPAPLAGALDLAPKTLRRWSAEALSLAMPPLRIAAAIGRGLATPATGAASPAKPTRSAPARKKAAARRPPRSRAKADQ